VARPERVELPTFWFVAGWREIPNALSSVASERKNLRTAPQLGHVGLQIRLSRQRGTIVAYRLIGLLDRNMVSSRDGVRELIRERFTHNAHAVTRPKALCGNHMIMERHHCTERIPTRSVLPSSPRLGERQYVPFSKKCAFLYGRYNRERESAPYEQRHTV
jgi:hypothetical protein